MITYFIHVGYRVPGHPARFCYSFRWFGPTGLDPSDVVIYYEANSAGLPLHPWAYLGVTAGGVTQLL
jgi:hypothetical protein